MTEKLQESAQYLKCCSNIEIETFRLYETISKKINHPESSFILGFGYDSLKNSKILQGLLQAFDLSETEDMECKRNLAELAAEVSAFSKIISRINNIDYESLIEIFKELIHLEDLLSQVYNDYLESNGPRILADEMSKLVTINLDELKKIFERFTEEKGKHRETLIETVYCFEAKEAERLKHTTPIVKYKNPDSWINQSTLHAFS